MSSNGWPLVPLAEVVTHRKEFIQIDDLSTYKRCRVQLHAQGVVLRDEVEGALIKTKTQQVCRTDEFLVAEIDAKVGGFGLVPPELDGAIVSSHYFLFTPRKDCLDKSFLGYYCRTPAFREQVTSRGTTNYAAIRPSHVMRYTIPLPQLNEQHRIVARIDRLSSKIHEAQRLLRESTRQITAIRASIFASILTNDSWPIDTVGRRIGRAALRNGKSVKPGDASSNVSCLRLSAVSGGRINLSDSKPVPLTDAEASEYVIKTGDVFVMRGNGSKSLVGQAAFADATDGKTIFPDLLIRIPLANSGWTPEFFVHFWNCPIMRRQVETAAKTTAGIWKINQGHIAEMSLPCPPVEVQQRLVAIAESLVVKTAEIKAMQSKESEELNVMFTSILDRAFRGAL